MHFTSFQHISTYHAYPSVHFPNSDSLMVVQQCIYVVCTTYVEKAGFPVINIHLHIRLNQRINTHVLK